MTFVYLGTEPEINSGGKDNDKDDFGDQNGKAKIEVGDGVDDDDTAYIVATGFDTIDDIQKGLDRG